MSSKRRHGGTARKSGERYPGGKLKQNPYIDAGSDAVQANRVAMVGAGKAGHQKAGCALGVLELRGDLADPELTGNAATDQAAARFLAGERFAADHVRIFGLNTPRAVDLLRGRSVRGEVGEETESDREVAIRYGRKVAAVRLLPSPHRPYPFHVLVAVAVNDELPKSPAELDALRRALAALVSPR